MRRSKGAYYSPVVYQDSQMHMAHLYLTLDAPIEGIPVCEEWKDFENFKKWSDANGYPKWNGEPHDDARLERIDKTKGYSPDNCRWVDKRYTF